MSEFEYTAFPEKNSALEDLKRKIKTKDSNLAIFFLTPSLIDYFKDFSRIVKCDSIAVPVEGFVTRTGVWTRGGLVWLIDEKVEVEKYFGGADEVCKKLKASKSGKFSLLIYPTVYLSSRVSALATLLKERRYYNLYKKGQKFALAKVAKLLRDKVVYPINDILRPFRDREEATVSLNLFPLEFKWSSPILAYNGEKIGRGLLRIKFSDLKSLNYTDTFPERGNTFEENLEILKRETGYAKPVEFESEDVAIGYVDGKTLVEFAFGNRAFKAENFVGEVNKGDFVGATPQGLWMFSKKGGFAFLGIFDIGTNIYPSLYNTNYFEKLGVFTLSEVNRYLVPEVCSFLDDHFDIAFLDQNYLLIYERNVVELKDCMKESFGIFVLSPAASFKPKRNYFTEIEEGIFSSLTRNVVSIEI